MKYTVQNPPMRCYMTQSRWYRMARNVEPMGVCWHSTGANNPNLARYVQPDDTAADRDQILQLLGTNQYRNDWNHLPDLAAGVHAFIGQDAHGEVRAVNVGPWIKEAWGVGTGTTGFSLNQGWIQFEICEDGLNNAVYAAQVYREAIHLTAYLCQLFKLDPKGTVSYHGIKVPVITCHADAFKLGMGSGHVDPLNWLPKFGYTMQTIRDDVHTLLLEYEKELQKEEEQPVQTGTEKRYQNMQEIRDGFPWAADTVQKLVDAGYLSGTDDGLDLSQDMLRMLTVIHKAGGLPKI